MLTEKEASLLEKVPAEGTKGNEVLRRELGWSHDEYWDTRNRLIDRGYLEVWRGRGGTVRRPGSDTGATLAADLAVPLEISTPPQSTTAPEGPRVRETDLYAPLARVLEHQWVKDKRYEAAVVQTTALQGRRHTGGRWTRPDITVAAVSTYLYVPGRHFDVVTFEVKPWDAVDVTAVYEALGHLRCANKAYALLHVPPDKERALEDEVLEVQGEAKKHGIGLLVVGQLSDYSTWDERVEPRRFEPEPHRLNDFLANQLTDAQLERWIRWFR